MDLSRLERKAETEWWIPPTGAMRVPGVIYASEGLVREMDDKVFEQVSNVATLPGIQRASYAMPDAHWAHRDHLVQGDRAVSEWTFSGTAADGSRIEAEGADLFRLREGRIVHKQALRKQRPPMAG